MTKKIDGSNKKKDSSAISDTKVSVKSRSRGRKYWTIRILAIGLPIFLEIFLRIIHYGNDYPLFIQDVLNPNYLRISDNISKRYFTLEQGPLGLLNETFRKVKDQNTLRIFVQGSSTTLGFPYLRGASFPRVLKARLMKAFPGKNIEVINTAITAVNSYTFLDLSNEIIAQKPDAVIIYPEHNEFYGALGIGSYQKFGDASWLVRLYLNLRKIKLVQLINNFKMWLSTRDIKDQLLRKSTLMERMAREQRIPYNSSTYKSGLHQIESNLAILLSKYEKNNIPVFIGSVVSKVKDLPPFSSESESADSLLLKRLIQEAKLASEAGRNDEAIGILKQATSMDSLNASLHYMLAVTELAAGKNIEARFEFYKAKDLDLLRFRSPEDFNRVIAFEAQKYHSHFIDLKKIFQEKSPDGIPGNNLLTEHVHPNMQGDILIANAFYNAFKSAGIKKDWVFATDDSLTYADLPSTQIDSIQGELQLYRMKSLWPYKASTPGIDPVLLSFKPLNLADSLGFQLYQQKMFWINAQEKMFNYLMFNGQYGLAMKTATALKFEFSSTDIGYIYASKVDEIMHNYPAQKFELEQAYALKPNNEVATQIARLSLELNDFVGCENYLSLSLKGANKNENLVNILNQVQIINSRNRELQIQPKNAKSWIGLGVAYLNIGKVSLGQNAITNAMLVDTNDPTVMEFLSKYGDKIHISKTGNK